MNTFEAFSFCVGADKLLKSNKELPVKIHFAIRRAMNALMPLYNAFNDTKQDIVKRYAVSDENGNVITDDDGGVQIKTSDIDIVNRELNEIGNQDSDIEVPVYITEEDLLALNISLTSEEYNVLQFITKGVDNNEL